MLPSTGGRGGSLNGKTLETWFALAGLTVFLTLYGYRVMAWQVWFRNDGWVTGDWLINYSQGLIRRGLVGAVADLCRALGVSPITFVLVAKATLYMVSCASLLALFWRRLIGVIELALLMSPWALMFDLSSPGGAGRKELVLFAVFATYCLLADLSHRGTSYLDERWVRPFLIVGFPLLTLVHEGLFFFLQFFLCHAWVSRPSGSTLLRTFAVPYALAAGVFAVSVVFSGTPTQAAALCSALTGQGLSASLCVGSIDYLDGHGALGTFGFRIHRGYYEAFIPLGVLTFFTLAFYGRQVLAHAQRRPFLVACVAAMLATAPLYVAGGDWGRWIHMSALLVFLTILSRRRAPPTLGQLPRGAVVGLLVLLPVYTCLWRLPHWIGPRGDIGMAAYSVAKWINALFVAPR